MIFAQRRWTALLCALLAFACVTPPRPAPETVALAANARAFVEGRVTDREGHPVAAIGVQGLPRGKDAGWSAAAVTDSEGRFRLSLVAPAEYGFILSWRGRTVITPEDADPAHLRIAVLPGQRREGIELLFLRDAWERLP
jgi:protocatechuate 3,4-dioxygenase beta subunit